MLKKPYLLFLFSLLLFATACKGGPASNTEQTLPIETAAVFFSSMPGGNGLVFLGAADKRSDPEETLQFALEDAAKRVSAFHMVYGEYGVEINIGSGAFDYVHNTHTSLYYDQTELEQYAEALQFNPDTDTLEMENTLIVRATYPAILPAPVGYLPTYNAAGRPNWVDTPPPKIAGYEIAVGYSSRFSSFADTCTNSYYNAIFAIIRNIHSFIEASDTMYWTNESLFGYKTDSNKRTYSYGTLTGFYVLDTWIDPKGKTLWTLAIARKDSL